MFPHTQTRRIVLDPASTADARDNVVSTLLRTGLESVRPVGDPAAALMERCCAAFLVRQRASGAVLGFSMLHGLRPAGHVRCGLYLDPQQARMGVGAEAVHLTVNYAFAAYDVTKVIAQTTRASFAAFGLSEDEPSRTAVLDDFLYFRGRFWDLHTFEVQRWEWEYYIGRNLDRLLPPPLSWRTAPA
ncbi:GNAT family N-acetyltransferase [Streptomyces sp. AK010]|uniref:GNAT family N-acetyltransferase n=1 Tax=Streptomyces sp. AK010 TaxID=2723074 RepID=UPI00160A4014|nr:GNAT family protein [Streptomyces sp. AK010]MBB6421392.1 hypothetical protein [Streptomyces sp. AK010]